jgi:triphosphoribosyl-dephospho-CoA synthase
VNRDSHQDAVLDVQTACLWEVTARKVGNVHRFRDFADTTYLDFALSAAAIGPVVVPYRLPALGRVILDAVRATQTVSPRNTNLGIILTLAPLAFASQIVHGTLAGTWRLIRDCDATDAKHVYEAIRLANPGGLGDAPEQDVRAEPTVTLLEAMKLAADRDLVARQYANGFADVFDFGVPAFLDGFARFGCVEAAIIDSQFRWLAEYPDSLIARKNGPAVAEDVRRRAADILKLGGIATPEGRRAGVALDRHLRSDGNKLNPGTTADLITACLFVALREGKVAPSAPFRWPVEDWL